MVSPCKYFNIYVVLSKKFSANTYVGIVESKQTADCRRNHKLFFFLKESEVSTKTENLNRRWIEYFENKLTVGEQAPDSRELVFESGSSESYGSYGKEYRYYDHYHRVKNPSCH